MEPMKRINLNSHFELMDAETVRMYGSRIVQIMPAAEIQHWEDHVFLCEVENAPDFPVYVSELKLDDISEEKRDEVEKAIIEKTGIAYRGEMPRGWAVTEEEQHEKTN